jgi:hypothetical protein
LGKGIREKGRKASYDRGKEKGREASYDRGKEKGRLKPNMPRSDWT